MRIYDIIAKKRDKRELTYQEIKYFIEGYVNEDIADYQVSALLMAIFLNGMTRDETAVLTDCMAHSGEIIDLSRIKGIKVDKHSTGGVGDKTTLICAPIAAACGTPIAKMSGRGLGYTGGTIDKLESIPGMKLYFSKEEFINNVNNIGISIAGQSGNLVPADKKIYALRDVTATVESIPLIASSIMSKKIASGADCILLDVKVGSGAFMKTKNQAIELAQTMVQIGKDVGRKTVAVITDMNNPLGMNIGNSLEVCEACDILKGNGSRDLRDVSLYLAANMLYLSGMGNFESCIEMSRKSINDGTAFEKLKMVVSNQGGDTSVIDNPNKISGAKQVIEVKSRKDGYIESIDAERCGVASVILGAGREKKDSAIDLSAGIVFKKKAGDYLKQGEVIAEVHSSSLDKCAQGSEIISNCLKSSDKKPRIEKIISMRITEDGIENL